MSIQPNLFNRLRIRPSSHKIFLRTILRKKDIFSSKYCSDILQYFQTRLFKKQNCPKINIFNSHTKKYWLKNVLSFYCNVFLSQIVCKDIVCNWALILPFLVVKLGLFIANKTVTETQA